MSIKNHEIIGIRLKYDMDENVQRVIADFKPDILQVYTVNDAKELACRAHLGYVTSAVVREIIRTGANWAVGYFKKGDTRKEGWFKLLWRGLLLCLLVEDNDAVRDLCVWAKPTKKPDYNPVLPDEFQLLYLCLASLFQEKPAKQFGSLFEKITACRNKEVRLLVKALNSLVNRDQGAFEKAILDCVEHHKTKPKPDSDAYFMEDWLPLHANVLFLSGLQLGLKRPDFPPNVMAYLMTPESVGFGK